MLGPQPRNVGSSPTVGTMQYVKLTKKGNIVESNGTKCARVIRKIQDIHIPFDRWNKKEKQITIRGDVKLLMQFRDELAECQAIFIKTGRKIISDEYFLTLAKINGYLIMSYKGMGAELIKNDRKICIEDTSKAYTGIDDLEAKMNNAALFIKG